MRNFTFSDTLDEHGLCKPNLLGAQILMYLFFPTLKSATPTPSISGEGRGGEGGLPLHPSPSTKWNSIQIFDQMQNLWTSASREQGRV